MSGLHVDLDEVLPERLAVGRGTSCVVQGYCFDAGADLKALDIVVEQIGHRPVEWRVPREDVFARYRHLGGGRSLTSGFWDVVHFGPGQVGRRVHVKLRARFRRGVVREAELGVIECCEREAERWQPPADLDARVVICMASYDPPLTAFFRQLDSIQAQSHEKWVCLVNDDHTPREKYEQMTRRYADDPRIVFFRNEANLGFYRNFGVCLAKVPEQTEFVALADQDDVWYAHKLARCLAEFSAGTQLVYSDMRIVTTDGTVVSNTYWHQRKNNYSELDLLLLANTVTGAASIFRASLLDRILPLPQRVGDAYHDQWIACVARALGEIRYVDEALYDYLQSGENIIGHCDFPHRPFGERLARLGSALGRWSVLILKVIYRRVKMRKKDPPLLANLINLMRRLVEIHHEEFRRLKYQALMLERRVPELSRAHRRAVRIFRGGPGTVWRLLRLHMKITWRKETTNDAELRMLGALLAYRTDGLLKRVFRKHFVRNPESRFLRPSIETEVS